MFGVFADFSYLCTWKKECDMRIGSIKSILIGFWALVVSLPVFAYDFADNGIYLNLKSDGTLEVVGLATWTTRADIPSDVTINGRTYRVTSIKAWAFEGRSDITYISIPWSVTSIGEYAFIDCGSNISVNIADPECWCQMELGNEHASPLSSAGKVLVHDIETTSIDIPETVASIGKFTFYQCRKITSLNIPSSVTSIGSSAFEDCTGLTSVTLSEGLTSIGGSAFEGCNGLTSITIPSTVTSIALNAFKDCSSLNNITSEIREPFAIDENVFSTYTTATLTVPSGTKSAYQSTAGWNNFSKIVEPSPNTEFTINDINYHIISSQSVEVLSVNNSLKLVTIPESVSFNGIAYRVTSIGEWAFEGREDITYLSIPSSITSIGEYAFIFCGSNIKINIESLEAWCRVSFGNEHSCPLSSAKTFYLNDVEVENLTIPYGVVSISDYAFYQCRSLFSLSIPSTVASIGSSAFEECTGLTSISLSNGLNKIDGSSFEGCTGLTAITIPSSVTSIKLNAFKGCTNLNSITSEIQNPFAIEENVFSTYTTATLKVPAGTKIAYQSTAGWYLFRNIIDGQALEKDDVLFTIDGLTYQGTKSAKTVVVTSVDNGLVSVEIPASVSFDGTTYQVTGIDNAALKGTSLAAMIWNVEAALSNNAFSNSSIGSNFLLYVKSASYAPSSVKNVVVSNSASSIQLSDDGGPFYCPQTFTASSISYTHNYSMETGGDGKGWETIALPFDVQRINHSQKGEIVPFASYSSSSSQKSFWLANFSSSDFRRISTIKANEPYIIAMPNNSKYKSDYILVGDVSFTAENVQVTKTPSFSGLFVPTFTTVAKSSTVHALNVNNRYVKYSGRYEAGSCFISDLRDIRPFEAYFSDSSTRGIFEIKFDGGATDIDRILLSVDEGQKVTIYTLSGLQVVRTALHDFDAVWQQLPKGVYIVNGKKWIK